MLSQQTYEEVINRILKNGLRPFKKKNILSLTSDNNKKGVIAGFSSKRNMMKTEGTLYQSMDKLFNDSELLTHWTPNVYSWLGGGQTRNRAIWGHDEQNLIQINAFVADIDYPAGFSKTDIITLTLTLLEEGLLPTVILDTPKGYHVYFLIQNYNQDNDSFDKPSYISSANEYKSLRVAKRISENIRKAIKNRLPHVDMGCNHFGIFRFPTRENILHYEPNFVSDFEGYLKWSQNFEAEEKKKAKANLKLVKRAKKGYRQVDTKWYQFLSHTDIQVGDRNRTIFTLALACKSSGLSMSECIDQMDQIVFSNDLTFKEVKRTVRSAYEGAYKGAKAEHINDIISNYATPDEYKAYAVAEDSKPKQSGKVDPSFWVKFAKPREERTYNHFKESQEDLLAYLESKQKALNEDERYITINMIELAKEAKIALSSLKVILKQLKKQGLIVLKTQRGRNGSTRIATKKFLQTRVLMALIMHKRNVKHFASKLLSNIAPELVTEIVAKYKDKTVPFKVNKAEYLKAWTKNKIRGASSG